jgi:amino acid adenylation domain-containing protein
MSVFTVRDMLDRAAAERPNRAAIEDATTKVTWRELQARVEQVAVALGAAGLNKGDRVAIIMENSVAHVAAMLGVIYAGGVFVNVNPRLKARQVQHILADSGAAIAIVQLALRETVAGSALKVLDSERLFIAGATVTATLPRLIDRDVACFIYTSGSTGKPKGVVFRHADLVMCARIMVQALGHTADDRTLCTLPFSADYGLTLLYMSLLTGSTLVLRNTFLAQDVVGALRDEHITAYSGITPIWAILYGSRSDFGQQSFPDLRYLTIGGGYPPRRVMEQLMKQFAGTTDIYMLYGLTEASWSTYVPPQMLAKKYGSIGIALPNVDVMILDEDGQPCQVGQEGELVHRGGVVAQGYWNNPDKTKQVFRAVDGERVVFSGDLVTKDTDGYISFKSRKDGQIKVQGFRVATQDVIDCIHETGLVDDACLFSVPDEETQQRLIACVTAKATAADGAAQVLQHLKQELPSYMVPKELYFLERMPYTQSHKIDVVRLRELYEANKLVELATQT